MEDKNKDGYYENIIILHLEEILDILRLKKQDSVKDATDSVVEIKTEVAEEVKVAEEVVKEVKEKWYKWKLWRLSYAPRHVASSVCEGNNRWKRLFGGFFWRYDKTGSGTRD